MHTPAIALIVGCKAVCGKNPKAHASQAAVVGGARLGVAWKWASMASDVERPHLTNEIKLKDYPFKTPCALL